MWAHSEEGSYIAEISTLGDLQPIEMLDLDNYKDASEGVVLPKAGRYTVQAPDSFPTEAFGRTRADVLRVQIDPTITGPSNEGYQIRFTNISAKPFKRGGVTVSQVGDYLRACGVRGRLNSEADIIEAVKSTVNRTYEVAVDWRAYNKNTGFSVEGMANFPSDGNGGHQSWIEDPEDKDENGKAKRLRANLTVDRYIAASA